MTFKRKTDDIFQHPFLTVPSTGEKYCAPYHEVRGGDSLRLRWIASKASMSRVYVGNLPMDIKEKDLEDIFYKYGKITDMQIKTPERPPAFGFVTFDDPRDADEAVRAR